MTSLTIVQKLPPVEGLHGHRQVRLQAERATLAKRRWRGIAGDGREFGFDLGERLTDGTPFHVAGDVCYVIEQLPEEVVEIPVAQIKEAARIAWSLGNLHFPVEVTTHSVRVTGDPAVLQFLDRESIAYRKVNVIFLPLSGGEHHHHHD